MGYREGELYVLVSFYVDDGLLFVRSCAEAEDMIGVVLEWLLILLYKYNHRRIPPEKVRP